MHLQVPGAEALEAMAGLNPRVSGAASRTTFRMMLFSLKADDVERSRWRAHARLCHGQAPARNKEPAV